MVKAFFPKKMSRFRRLSVLLIDFKKKDVVCSNLGMFFIVFLKIT